MRMIVALLAALVWAGVPCHAQSNVFQFRDGSRIEGTVVRTTPDGRVTIRMKTGVRTHRMSEFAPETVAEHFPDTGYAPAGRQPLRWSESRERTALSDSERKTLWGLAISGAAVFVVGLIWLTVAAFSVSPTWGIAFILSGGSAELAFIILHWKRARWPLLAQMLGLGLVVAAVVLLVRGGGWGSVLPWRGDA